MSRGDERLEELLSSGHLSGAAYDRIEARVLARTARKEPRAHARWLPLAAAICGTMALLLVVGRTRQLPSGSGFTAKGEHAAASGGSVELACSSEDRPCRAGDTLMFLVDSGAHSGYLNASAVRLEPPSEERVWFFPTAEGDAPHVALGQGTVVAPQGIRLTAQQRPGLYRVDIWFSESKPERRVPTGLEERVISVRLEIED